MNITISPDDDFDQVLMRNRRPGTIFQLLPGVHYTRGVWFVGEQLEYYKLLASGCSLIGSGVRNTVIRFDVDRAAFKTNGNPRPDRDLGVLWAGADVTISDLTIDGSCNHPVLADSAGNPRRQWYVTCGLRIYGSCDVRRIRIINVNGCYNPNDTLTKTGIECFPISAVNWDPRCTDYYPAYNGGSVFEDIEVSNVSPEAYVSGITMGYTRMTAIGGPSGPGADIQIRPSIVRNCVSLLGRDNHYNFSGNISVTFDNCRGEGARHGFYNDTNEVYGWRIQNCVIGNPEKETTLINGISLLGVDAQGHRRDVKVTNCKFTFKPTPTGEQLTGLTVWDVNNTGLVAEDIEISSSTFGPDTSSNFYIVSLVNAGARNIRVRHCVLPSTSKRYRRFALQTTGVLETFQNWRHNGMALPNFLPETYLAS